MITYKNEKFKSKSGLRVWLEGQPITYNYCTLCFFDKRRFHSNGRLETVKEEMIDSILDEQKDTINYYGRDFDNQEELKKFLMSRVLEVTLGPCNVHICDTVKEAIVDSIIRGLDV